MIPRLFFDSIRHDRTTYVAYMITDWAVQSSSNTCNSSVEADQRYPNSMLDFAFVVGKVKDWKPKCRVIVCPDSFPDRFSTGAINGFFTDKETIDRTQAEVEAAWPVFLQALEEILPRVEYTDDDSGNIDVV